MPFDPGDIYWAEPSQTIGHEQRKTRPYIVMSRRVANQRSFVGVPLTTDKDGQKIWPAYCIRIPAREIIKDANCTSSINDSVALCHQVRILAIECVKGKIGVMNRTAVLAVQLGLAYLFDMPA